MKDINHVVLVGRLTRDAELKYTNSGTALSKFSLAVNRSIKKGTNGQMKSAFLIAPYGASRQRR